jgi:flagellar basal-body rod protein FlgC
MSLSNVFNIAGSGMMAQSMRLNVVASNLANADSVTSSNGQPYRARQVVFSAKPIEGGSSAGSVGVKVEGVVEDPSPLKMLYDPKNPAADAKGFVAMPNVNVVEEMVNMISASRSYQNNVDVMNTAKSLMMKTLTIGQAG